MKQANVHKIALLYSFSFSVIVAVLFLGVTYIQANWSNPTDAPPNGNVAAPIHTGSGYQTKGGTPPENSDTIETGQFVASYKMRSDLYCDVTGDNCLEVKGSENNTTILDTDETHVNKYCDEDGNNCLVLNRDDGGPSSLIADRERHYYQRVGSEIIGQTGEHVKRPDGGGNWDFCVTSGARRFDKGPIQPTAYNLRPAVYDDNNRHSGSSYQSVEGSPQCSVFFGGGNMKNRDGNRLAGGRWTILLSDPKNGVVSRCIATCFKLTD